MGSSRDGLLGMDAFVYLAMGGFILVFSLMIFALVGFRVPELLGFCVFGGIAPSSIVALYGLYRWRVERHLRALAAMAQTYRRLKLDEFARRAGRPRLQTEQRLAEAGDRGYVKGFVGRPAGWGVGPGA